MMRNVIGSWASLDNKIAEGRMNICVVSVILCVAVVSVTYVVSTMVEQLQRDTSNDTATVVVSFSQVMSFILHTGNCG